MSNPFGDDTESNKVEDDKKKPGYMDSFFEQVELVKQFIDEIHQASELVLTFKTKTMTSSSPDEDAINSSKLSALCDKTSRKGRDVKEALKRLKKQTEEIEKDKSVPESQLRIRKNQYATLSRQLVDAMDEYKKVQEDYEAQLKNKVSRQVRIVNPDAKDEDIDRIIEKGDPSQFIKQAIVGPVNAEIEEEYRKAQDKYKDIVKLVQSVRELQQLFQDMAVLIQEQGEMLNQIEYNVKSAHQQVTDGNKKLVQAIEQEKQVRKTKCCLLICVLILIVIIFVVTGIFTF